MEDQPPLAEIQRRLAEAETALAKKTQAEAELRANADRHRLIIDNARDYAILTIDPRGIITSWSRGAEAVFGWAEDEAAGKDVAIIFTPEDREAGAPEKERAAAAREGFAQDIRWHERRDGSRAFIDGFIRPLRDAGGEVTGYLKIGRDVTEKRRLQDALEESEARFRQFAYATSDVLWIRDAETLSVEFLSPSFDAVFGMPSATVLDDPRQWAATVVPEDREAAQSQFDEARQGRHSIREFRIMRASDGAFRWIRNHAFPLVDEQDRVVRLGGIATDVTQARQLSEHQNILVSELQHRVRNIMAKIRAVTTMSARSAESVADYERLVSGRLMSLARTQALLTRSPDARVDIRTIVIEEVAAQAQHESQYALDGPAITLPPKAAEVLALAIHELSTNALKYGALTVSTGFITITWSLATRGQELWVVFDWVEQGGPATPPPMAPGRRGFGTQLIEQRISYELRGHAKLTIAPGGATCHLEFPLRGGASVLETDAPIPTSVHGGALDMSDEPGLTGQRVLVLEDDFYLAVDSARALRGAGAEVAGPFPDEATAVADIESHPPTAALLDINLGNGPSYAVARRLRALGLPFTFLTGYDRQVIPPEFADVERLEKPVELRQLVRTIARLAATEPASPEIAG